MQIKLALFLILIITLISCSSDPCENVTCVNGDCIDGTCQCEEGYIGERCDELPCVNGTSVNGLCNCEDGNYGVLCETSDILGGYFITKFLVSDCPNYAKQYDLEAPASDGRVCGTNTNGVKICFSNGLTIREDGTMFWLRSIVLETEPDKFETTFFEFEQGTYTARNDKMTINLNNGETRVVIISKNKLTWTQFLSDGGTDKCNIIEEYTIR